MYMSISILNLVKLQEMNLIKNNINNYLFFYHYSIKGFKYYLTRRSSNMI